MKGLFDPAGRAKLAHMLVYGAEPPDFVRPVPKDWKQTPYPGEIIEDRILKVLERMAPKLEVKKEEDYGRNHSYGVQSNRNDATADVARKPA